MAGVPDAEGSPSQEPGLPGNWQRRQSGGNRREAATETIAWYQELTEEKDRTACLRLGWIVAKGEGRKKMPEKPGRNGAEGRMLAVKMPGRIWETGLSLGPSRQKKSQEWNWESGLPKT